MFIQQLYTNCLAEAAYYIESEGEAVIIDPIRETDQYISLAESRGSIIKYVFETHFHADFISGHIDLAGKTGAKIVFGPEAKTAYDIYSAKDGEEFKLGKIIIKALHTPGHTMESTCYLLIDEQGNKHSLFSGDTLFVGDVGRPDLLDGIMSKEDLAGHMFDSLQKLKTLPDETILYPAHGPGSSCGKNIGKETWSTIGQQKKSNYALLIQNKNEFVETLTNGLMPPPAYFFKDAMINKTGYSNLEFLLKKNNSALSISEFEREVAAGSMILDTRIPDDFEIGFIKGSINIGLNGTFAIWAGSIIPIEKSLVLITEPGKEEESITRLARVGFENIKGFLGGGFETWKKEGKPVEKIISINPSELLINLSQGEKILDVRKFTEAENGMVKDADLYPLSDLKENLNKLNPNDSYLVHCAGGYRSMIACSIMKAEGFHNVKNVLKGFSGIKSDCPEIIAEMVSNA
jgi:hydroxyacylglutathione hydrolase